MVLLRREERGKEYQGPFLIAWAFGSGQTTEQQVERPKTLAKAEAAAAGRSQPSDAGPPRFVAPGRVNGPSCGTGGISGTTDWRCSVARAG